MPTLYAHSISRSLIEALKKKPFRGQVMGTYEQVSNLRDEHGRVISLVTSTVGNGPFSIVLESDTSLLATLSPDPPIFANQHCVELGNRRISLSRATRWNPQLPFTSASPNFTSAVTGILKRYSRWPHPRRGTPLEQRFTRHLSRATDALQSALGTEQELKAAATKLAGLGTGLTPAGDDYLVGVLAALWFTEGPPSRLNIARIAAPKTTPLSAAYLRAASEGWFIEQWHPLSRALKRDDPTSAKIYTHKLIQWGSSSGRAALAGFATTLLRNIENTAKEK